MDAILDFAKNVLPPLDPNLLVISDRIGEVLKIVYDALYTLWQ
jgi:hypothetical protein